MKRPIPHDDTTPEQCESMIWGEQVNISDQNGKNLSISECCTSAQWDTQQKHEYFARALISHDRGEIRLSQLVLIITHRIETRMISCHIASSISNIFTKCRQSISHIFCISKDIQTIGIIIFAWFACPTLRLVFPSQQTGFGYSTPAWTNTQH